MFFASNAAAPGKSASDASAAVREKPWTVKSQSCRECLSTKYVNVVKAAVIVVLSLQMHTGVCSLSCLVCQNVPGDTAGNLSMKVWLQNALRKRVIPTHSLNV